MHWIKEAVRFEGRTSPHSFKWYRPKVTPIDPDVYLQRIQQLYSWPPGNPRIFLGPADPQEIKRIETITGMPVCKRIDVAFQQNKENPNLSPADYTFQLPEYKVWEDAEMQSIWPEFKMAADTVVQAWQETQGQCPIYVHCVGGVNRSAAVLAAALTRITGNPLRDVLQDIKTGRGSISPMDPYFAMAAKYSPSDSEVWKQQVWQELDTTGKENVEDDWTMVAQVGNWLTKLVNFSERNLRSLFVTENSNC